MAKFLKKILVSLLFTLLVCTLMDLWLSNYLQHTSKRKYEIWTKIVNGEFQDNDLLVFGSSRAWVHYSPVILDSVLGVNSYNMGIDGSACDRQILRWELYKRFGNAKPRYIIHNIDYVSTLYSTNGYERDQFFPYFWNMDFRDVLFKFENFSIAEKYIPMYRYSVYGVRNILNFDTAKLKKGYEGQNKAWDGSKFKDMNTIQFSYSPEIEKLFDSYVKSVKESGIELIFVMSPMYYGTKEKCTQLELMYTTYKRFSEKYNIPLLDYTFSEISKDTTNFYNAMHLNKKGSELFSKELANDLKNRFFLQSNDSK